MSRQKLNSSEQRRVQKPGQSIECAAEVAKPPPLIRYHWKLIKKKARSFFSPSNFGFLHEGSKADHTRTTRKGYWKWPIGFRRDDLALENATICPWHVVHPCLPAFVEGRKQAREAYLKGKGIVFSSTHCMTTRDHPQAQHAKGALKWLVMWWCRCSEVTKYVGGLTQGSWVPCVTPTSHHEDWSEREPEKIMFIAEHGFLGERVFSRPLISVSWGLTAS